MPNWCENRLAVSGDKEQLKKFVEQGKTKESLLSFNQFIPYPEVFAILDKKANEFNENRSPTEKFMQDGFNNGGRTWRLENWGVKWDLSGGTLTQEGNTKATYQFDTAWGSPSIFVKSVSKQFPKLTFEIHYAEEGMMFVGTGRYKRGRTIFEEYSEDFKTTKEFYQKSELHDKDDYDAYELEE